MKPPGVYMIFRSLSVDWYVSSCRYLAVRCLDDAEGGNFEGRLLQVGSRSTK